LNQSARHQPLTANELQGYLVWGITGSVIVVPEVWAAISSTTPFVPLTETIGHLSGPWKFIVAFLILSFAGDPAREPTHDGPSRSAVLVSRLYVPVALVAVLAGCWLVAAKSESKWLLAYTIYGLLALVTVIIPTVLAYVFGKDLAFPTFGLTLKYLEHRHHLTALAINNVTRLLRLR
jgi:hypothetical protein